MTSVELLVVAGCLVAGYGVVSFFIGGRDRGPSRPPAPPPLAVAPPPVEPPWHEVLGVEPDATLEDIGRAREALLAQYGHDRVAELAADLRDLAARRRDEVESACRRALAERRSPE